MENSSSFFRFIQAWTPSGRGVWKKRPEHLRMSGFDQKKETVQRSGQSFDALFNQVKGILNSGRIASAGLGQIRLSAPAAAS